MEPIKLCSTHGLELSNENMASRSKGRGGSCVTSVTSPWTQRTSPHPNPRTGGAITSRSTTCPAPANPRVAIDPGRRQRRKHMVDGKLRKVIVTARRQ